MMCAVVVRRLKPGAYDAFRQAWLSAQQAQLAELRESFAGLPVRELPYGQAEPVGEQALRGVADALYGVLPGDDPAQFSATAAPMTVESADGDYVLRMPLPLVERAAVDAARAGDDLVLTVGPHRRVLTLPSVLRRCEVAGGELADGELRVRFRPNPNLWPRTDADTESDDGSRPRRSRRGKRQ